jgi:uncharacterized protein YfaS (alpha-2-macroglobulin family)
MRTFFIVSILVATSASAAGNPTLWKRIEKLESDQQLKAALPLVEQALADAQKSGDDDGVTHALIERARLELGLSAPETAVRHLREAKWPAANVPHTVLDLYYAQVLTNYRSRYGYEILRREQQGPREKVDLKSWTAQQIREEIDQTFLDAWKRREALGASPLSAVERYLTPNDFPAGIRSTLRDAVSYLWTENLGSTFLWSAAESSSVYSLDLQKLLGEPKADLADVAVHPLMKIATVLADLEGWHRARGNLAGALEARIRRDVILHGHFESQDAKRTIRNDLERQVTGARSVSWFSQGMAELGTLLFDAGDRPAARAAAIEGERAYPKSVGAQNCRALIASIDAPGLSMLLMQNDSAQRRSIALTHRNLKRAYFRAYRFDLERYLRESTDYNRLPAAPQMVALVAHDKPVAQWSVELPATPDYQDHRTFVVPPLEAKGGYVIVASAREDFSRSRNSLVAAPFLLNDLLLRSRELPEGGLEVETLDATSGAPIADVPVTLYRYDYRSGHVASGTSRSDAHGLLHFMPGQNASYFLVAKHGGDLALEPNEWWLGRREPPEPDTVRALVFTDRQVYRPGQQLHWKVVSFDAKAGDRFSVRPHTAVQVSLIDANDQHVEDRDVTTDDFGSVAGDFSIPMGRLLGGWRIEASNGTASFRVEEYKRPTFEVSLDAPKSSLRLNRPASFVGHARYYFGLPVTSGKVAWRVYREPVFPMFFWWYHPRVERQLVAGGEAKVGGDGEFTAGFTPQGDEHADREVSYRFSLEADVTDEGGETRSAQRGFRLGLVAIEAQIDPAEQFFSESAPASFEIRRVDLDGTPRAGEASWWVGALAGSKQPRMPADLPVHADDPRGFHTEGDRLRPRWESGYQPFEDVHDWSDAKEVARGALRHGEDGIAKVELKGLSAGAYRLHYRTTDAFGATYESTRDWLVAGPKLEVPLAAVLITQREPVHVGETAHLLATSGIAGQPFELLLMRDQHVIDRRWIRAGEGNAVIDIPITDAMRGGFTATLAVVHDHQSIILTQSVTVPWDDKELKLSFRTFRDHMLPGANETWTVQVARPDGKPVGKDAAQVLAFMYDRALDIFGPFEPPAVSSIYPSHFGSWDVRATIGQQYASSIATGSWYELPEGASLRGDSLREISPYGIGGPGIRRFKAGAMAMPAAPPPGRGEETRDAAEPEKKPMDALAVSGRAANALAGKEAPEKAVAQSPQVTPRSNFAETAFWQPALLTNADGTVQLQFKVPDSVTSWNVWVEAITRALEGGRLHATSNSSKPLMVRPYLPRFLRVGDSANVKIAVNNASDHVLAGTVRFEAIDPETQASLSQAFGIPAAPQRFTVEPGKGTSVTFALRTPSRVGQVAFRAIAEAPGASDGELRPIPVLPSRVTLTQSRFVTLHDADERTLRFDDLAKTDDATRRNDQLVVTLDGQLFYAMLDAVPYLVNYPYECTEQTLNRFVSAGILSSLFERYPAIANVAKQLSKRTTPLQTFDQIDPNRKVALEETPWVIESKGGDYDSINVLDPRIAKANRESALAKLQKAQTSNGAFPWFDGGPPSPYMTLYIMYGFAKAAEFQVPVPKDVVQRGWAYLAQHYREEYTTAIALKRDWEFLTFLNFVASSYPDESWTDGAFTADERKKMLEVSLEHWKEHSPYLKSMLAITLVRMGQPEQAKKVFASVMDSSTTTRDEGTFWQPEDRSWLWYRDTIETQAFALRALMEVEPKDVRSEGLVQWLMLHKKLNHWKSTRATAEALYSVAVYLEQHKELAVPEQISVVLPEGTKTFDFAPDKYAGKQQVVIAGDQVTPKDASIVVKKPTKGLAFASASWTFSTEKPVSEASGELFAVTRRYFRRVRKGTQMVLEPLEEGAKLVPGDELEVQLSLRARHEAEYVHLRDPRAAGLEPEELTSGYHWDLGLAYYEEVRDSGTNFFFETLPVGEYTFHYRLRVALAGDYRVGPATVQSMYAPEFSAYSAGSELVIGP